MTRPGLQRYARATALVVAWIAWGQSLATWLLARDTLPPDAAAEPGAGLSVALLALLGVLLVVASLPHPALARPGLAGFVLTCGAGLLLLPTLLQSGGAPTRPVGAPPLMHVCTVGLLVTCVVWPRRLAWVSAAAVLGIGSLRVFLLDSEVTTAVLEAVLFVVLGLICPMVLLILESAARDVDEANAIAWRRRADLRRAERRARETERWDALLHDKVLGAFHLALRGDPAASGLAREAIGALETPGALGRPRPAPSFADGVERHARLVGLAVRVEQVGSSTEPQQGDDLDPEVAEALLDATCEALTNAARHAGVSECLVRADLSPTRCTVTITDEGAGFDLRGVGPRRRGLAGSIIQRLESVGGTASVRSRAGAGTRVRLRWESDAAARERGDDSPAQHWDARSLRHLLTLGVVATGLHFAIGAQYVDGSRLVGGSIAGAAVIAGLTFGSAVLPPGSRWGWALAPLALTTQLGLAALVPPPPGLDWRYWFIGAQDTMIGLTAFRQSAGQALSAVAAACAGLAAGMAISLGAVDPYGVLAATPQLLLCAGAGILLRRGLDRASATSAQVAREAGAARVSIVEEDERRRIAAERQQDLREVAMPTLRLVETGRPLDAADCIQVTHVEAALRDRLTAGTVYSAELAHEVATARSRGVTVELAAQGVPATGDAATRDTLAFTRVCSACLSVAAPGSRLVATFNPLPSGHVGSVVLLGPRVDRPRVDPVPPGLRLDASDDGESLLLDLWDLARCGEAASRPISG